MSLGRLRPSLPLARLPLLAALALGALVASGCATYRQDLERGIQYYDNNEHERSLAIFRVLESDIDSLKPEEQVRYYYYRGMTDYRLTSEKYDISADARHWLGLAAAGEKQTPSSLSDQQIGLLCGALGELNKKIYQTSEPVVEKELCEGKATAVDKKGEGKKGDDEEKPKKKGGDDGEEEKPKKKKKSDE